MKLKLLQIGNFYIRLDLIFNPKDDILLGLNTLTGVYKACDDMSMSNCRTFEFTELRAGILILGIAIGVEKEFDENFYMNGAKYNPGV